MPPKPKRHTKLRSLKYRLKPSDLGELLLVEAMLTEAYAKTFALMGRIETCSRRIQSIRRRFEGK